MKKVTLFSLLVTLFAPAFLLAQMDRNCSSMEYLEAQLQENPGMRMQMQNIERFTQQYVQTENGGTRMVYTIPVVVHVVYNTSAQNISDAQVQSQMDVLNEDFRRTNSDAGSTPSVFSGVASDVEVQFCLASVDPNGSSTTGITRTQTGKRSFRTNDDVKKSNKGGKDAWPAGEYLNIWVCNLSNSILGYAQFPGGPAATDGVVCTYAAFGRGSQYNLFSSFALGRTATHEVGHWLNLRHIWGDGGCGVDDFVGDTPVAGGPNYTGAPCSFPGPNTCNTGSGDLPDMFQNYMDYSDDGCMNLFTNGQTSRMRALFASGGFRESLLSSNGCGTGTGGGCTVNGVQDGNETGIDCGGPDCPACPPSGTCVAVAPSASTANQGKKRANISISWSSVSGANSYNAYLREVGAGSWSSQSTTGTAVTFSGLNRGTSYEYYVETVCTGATASTATFPISTNARLAADFAPMTVYPNPASNWLVIEFGELDNNLVDVQVLDLTGRTVYQRKGYDSNEGYLELDIAGLSNGVYLISMTDGSTARYVQKVVVQQ